MKHSIKKELKMRKEMLKGKMMMKEKVMEKHNKEMMEELKEKFKR